MRYILAGLLALTALTEGAIPADAGKTRGLSRVAYSTKMCIARVSGTRQASWKCTSEQRCCWDSFTRHGWCVEPGGACF